MVLLRNVILFFALILLAACASRKKENSSHADSLENTEIDKDFESKKPHVIFRLPIKMFQNTKMKEFLAKTEHSLGRTFPVLFVFVDTLRSDYAKKEMPMFQHIVSQKEDGWLDLQEGLSSSTITHFSTYSMYYSQMGFLRDFTLRANWNQGSPFLNILKKANYKILNYGSPWQSCFNSDRMYNANDEELKWSGAANLQIIFGQNPKSFTDFCFEGVPNEAAIFKEIPDEISVNGNTVKLAENNSYQIPMQHQAYQDYHVLETFKADLKSGKIPDNSFTQLYLFSVHMGYAWPEYGLPNKDWSSFSNPETFNIYKPYFSWTADERKYLDFKQTEEQLVNSYKNSVRYVDFLMGDLIKTLKESGKFDETMIVFVSDHGEKINEPDLSMDHWKKGPKRVGATHCCLPVSSNDRVPIYIKMPKNLKNEFHAEGQTLPRHYDVFPTIMGALKYNHFQDLSHLVVGKSLLAKRKGHCNISVSPRGQFGPRDFVASNGKKSLYLRLDEPRTVDALGVYFMRETSSTDENRNVHEFKKEDESLSKLGKYLKDTDYAECFADLFGDQYMKTLWFGQRLQPFHKE